MPLNNLPVEVLLCIFTCKEISDSPSVMHLSHTCSLWRNILFDNTLPWTKLPAIGASEDLVKMFLERSGKDRPLTLECPGKHRLDAWQESLIAENLHRFRRLGAVLCMDGQDGVEWLRRADRAPAILEELSLHIVGGPPTYRVLDRIFLHEAHSLKRIDLDGGRLSYVESHYNNLTRLSLATNVGRVHLNEGSILDALRRSPNLEELELGTNQADCVAWNPALDPLENIPLSGHARLFLPRLLQLSLKMASPHMALILGSVTLPSTLASLTLHSFPPYPMSPTRLLGHDFLPAQYFDALRNRFLCSIQDSVITFEAQGPIIPSCEDDNHSRQMFRQLDFTFEFDHESVGVAELLRETIANDQLGRATPEDTPL